MGKSPTHRGSDSDSSISILRSRIIDWGLEIERNYRDDRGVFCIKINTPRQSVYCTTKDYCFNEQASFPLRVVRRAEDYDCPLAVFFDDPEPLLDTGYVFNPDVVLDEGCENHQDVSLPNRSKWIDIHLDEGVLFAKYLYEDAVLD